MVYYIANACQHGAASRKFEFILIHVSDSFPCITFTVIGSDYVKFANYYQKVGNLVEHVHIK
jgi:hypothetical protein